MFHQILSSYSQLHFGTSSSQLAASSCWRSDAMALLQLLKHRLQLFLCSPSNQTYPNGLLLIPRSFGVPRAWTSHAAAAAAAGWCQLVASLFARQWAVAFFIAGRCSGAGDSVGTRLERNRNRWRPTHYVWHAVRSWATPANETNG